MRGVHLPTLLRDVLSPGTRLREDTYEIEYALGRGGFGITYRARHMILEQPVAIKEYYPQELAHRHISTGKLTVPQNKADMFQCWLDRFKWKKLCLWRRNNALAAWGRTIASGSWDKTLRLWDVASGSSLRQLHGHASNIKGVAFSPDGKFLVSVDSDFVIRLWEL